MDYSNTKIPGMKCLYNAGTDYNFRIVIANESIELSDPYNKVKTFL